MLPSISIVNTMVRTDGIIPESTDLRPCVQKRPNSANLSGKSASAQWFALENGITQVSLELHSPKSAAKAEIGGIFRIQRG